MTFRRFGKLLAKPSFLLIISLTGFLVLLFSAEAEVIGEAYAQGTPPITSSGLNTTVTQNGNTYNISGGTRPENSLNLFHSFGEFRVPANNIASFLNETALPTSNILGRVTGGNPSSIFGTLQTTGFGNANLFLMNTAGIVFGPNATLNVGGSVNFTTANYIRLFDESTNRSANFYANPASDNLTINGVTSVLSTMPLVDFGFLTPAAFGFLTATPANISVQGSALSVPAEQSISFVGGNVTIQSGTPEGGTVQSARLSAPGGQINLASVASPGEILHGTLQPGPNVTGATFTSMGDITLSEGTMLDVSANAAGTVKIRGSQLIIADSTLLANTVNTNGASTAIDINVTGDLSISDTRGAPAMTARTSGTGNAGDVQIVSANHDASTTRVLETPDEIFALIDSRTLGDGTGGNVSIKTGNLRVAGPSGLFYFVDSGVQGAGRGGDVTINANAIDLTGTTIGTGAERAAGLGIEASGPSGNLTFDADSLRTTDAHLVTTATSSAAATQQAGNIVMNVRDISLGLNTSVSTAGEVGGGITINGDRLVTVATLFDTFTDLGPGGGITFNGRILELTNGSSMSTSTFGDGNAGNITITASDHVSLTGSTGAPLGEGSPSGLFTNSFGFFGQGNAGDIAVTTPKLTINEGRINTSTASSGRGGNVTINAGTVEMFGEFPNTFGSDAFFTITNIHPSGIFSQTVGSDFCSGPCGNAGHITANIGSLVMRPGSQIDSGTTNKGQGGTITINATNTISMFGTLSDGSPSGIFSRTIGTTLEAGSGGNIALTAGQSVTISNGASVSASSTGPGNAGNIAVNAGQSLDLRDSSIKTEAAQASGGNIDIQAIDQVRLVNSTISTSVLGGVGSGGNITIDPNVVVLQNSQVIAQAVQGAGGNITITTPLFLADQTSLVSASSQFGLNGTVTIQSPTSNLSESLGTLTSKPSQAQSLLTQRCAALANGQASSFVVAGREQLPADPGGWLTSPLALAGLDADPFKDRTVAEGTSNLAPRTSGLLANDRVSLRRLTPVGFLTANFADSEATGCHS